MSDYGGSFEAIGFLRSACYEIRVLGRVTDDWLNRLGNMHCKSEMYGDKPVSVLVGEVRDQAELAGILSSLYELHLTLISLQLVKPGCASNLAQEAE